MLLPRPMPAIGSSRSRTRAPIARTVAISSLRRSRVRVRRQERRRGRRGRHAPGPPAPGRPGSHRASRLPEPIGRPLPCLHRQHDVAQRREVVGKRRDLEGATETALARAATDCAVTSWPNSRTVPASGLIAPDSCWISVVLPAPFGPISAWILPALRSSVTPSVAFSAPKVLVRPSTARTAQPWRGLPATSPTSRRARRARPSGAAVRGRTASVRSGRPAILHQHERMAPATGPKRRPVPSEDNQYDEFSDMCQDSIDGLTKRLRSA